MKETYVPMLRHRPVGGPSDPASCEVYRPCHVGDGSTNDLVEHEPSPPNGLKTPLVANPLHWCVWRCFGPAKICVVFKSRV